MKKLIILGMFLLFVAFKAYAVDNHDFQVWNIDSEEVKLNKHSKLIFEQEFHWVDNASKFNYEHFDSGYQYLFNDYFSFGGGFRYVKEKATDKFRDGSMPYFAAFGNWELFGFKFNDRIRIEYHYYDWAANYWRFRNKLDIKLPWKFTRFEIQPLIADEIFFRFNGIHLNQNRLYGGFAFNIIKGLKGELTYMFLSLKQAKTCTWTDANVLNIKLKYAF